MIGFSPGLAQGCFELIDLVSRTSLTFLEIRQSFTFLGSLPIDKVLMTAQELGWLRADKDSLAEVAPSGRKLLEEAGYEPMLRKALLDYIEIKRPAWVQNASYGRARVLRFAGREIAQVFVEAGLASSTEEHIIAFWDAMAALARGQKSTRLTEIGRMGERLSIAYENTRTGLSPKWVAVENNDDGYDVLSVVGAADLRPLSIEVKASILGGQGSLHLTRNEWERALEVEHHIFHVWAISAAATDLAVVNVQEMGAHVPVNFGLGSWESVEIPFVAFNSSFSSVSISDVRMSS